MNLRVVDVLEATRAFDLSHWAAAIGYYKIELENPNGRGARFVTADGLSIYRGEEPPSFSGKLRRLNKDQKFTNHDINRMVVPPDQYFKVVRMVFER